MKEKSNIKADRRKFPIFIPVVLLSSKCSCIICIQWMLPVPLWPPTDMELSCTPCEMSGPFLGLLEDHQQTHRAARTFSCTECDKSFSHFKSFEKHQNTHTGNLFACSQCNQSFSRSGSLKTHQRIQREEKPFGYSDCHQTWSRSNDRNTHQRIHTGEILGCSEGDKSFSWSHHLKEHMRIHTGEKPFLLLRLSQEVFPF